MAEKLVTGIAQSSDPGQLEDSLCNTPSVNCDKLAVITKDAPSSEHEESIVTFMHVGQGHATTDAAHDVITGSTGILTIIDHLADWPIPQDQIQNYNDAIEAGRSVVTYKADPDEAPGVEQTFRDAGLRNVKTFEAPKT